MDSCHLSIFDMHRGSLRVRTNIILGLSQRMGILNWYVKKDKFKLASEAMKSKLQSSNGSVCVCGGE